jgi:sulfur-oxidizing protein SoxZ
LRRLIAKIRNEDLHQWQEIPRSAPVCSKDKDTGKVIPAHFIQDVTLEINGKVAAEAKLGIAVSENPLLGFRFKPEAAKNGSKLKVSWKDNKGESSVVEAVVEV